MAGTAHPFVVTFGAGDPGVESDPDVHGGKGAGLLDLASAGVPVPPGFVLPTWTCRAFVEHGWTTEHAEALQWGIGWLEDVTQRRVGDGRRPLLVSVRSGAPSSMPGMLDSLLDVGIDDRVEEALAAEFGESDLAIDIRRRFRDGYRTVAGQDAPDDPHAQIEAAVAAVFRSHRGARARTFRRHTGGDELQPTAVVVQEMVFGNADDHSGTGVAFSRDPVTGDEGVTGEFLPRAQGVDVVAGRRRPGTLEDMARRVPVAHDALVEHVTSLARTRGDAVEVEFTVERGRLYLLQVRRSVSTDPEDSDISVADVDREPLIRGTAASPGVASGVLVTDLDDALARAEARQSVVLARPETTPADVEALAVAAALVTVVGGVASHAAVVARAWGIPAVVGCREVEWRRDGIAVADRFVPVGTTVIVDGTAGVVHVPHQND